MDVHLECKLKDCSRPVYRDPATNEIYLFCGRTHGRRYEEEAARAPGRPSCKLAGCDKPVFDDEVARVAHDCCGRSHAKAAGAQRRPLWINATQAALDAAMGKLCKLPGCSVAVCVEAGRVHEFCCKSHATKMAEEVGPQMKAGFELKGEEALRLIEKKHDEKQAHTLPSYIFNTDVYCCDPWDLPEVKRALTTECKIEDWLYWEAVPAEGKMKRSTGTGCRWKPATGKVTMIKDGRNQKIGSKLGHVYVHTGFDHKPVITSGPTGATQIRWKMLEYRAHSERLQKWQLVVISKVELAAAPNQGAARSAGEPGGSAHAQVDVRTDEADPTGESHQGAGQDPTEDLSTTEDVVAHWEPQKKRLRETEGKS